MGKHTLATWLVLGALGAALAGEPGPPPRREGQDMEARRRQAELMRRRAMMPGLPPQVIQFWEEVDPDAVDDLRRHLAANPQQRGDILRKVFDETRRLAEMRKNAPEAFDLVLQQRKLDRHVRKLGADLRKEKEQGERERVANELRATLDQLFEVREALREREIKGLEDRIKQLRDLAKKRRDHKAEIIEHRIKELGGELDYLKW
jgi:hypothetical protein